MSPYLCVVLACCADCTEFGISTRVDVYAASFIAAAVADASANMSPDLPAFDAAAAYCAESDDGGCRSVGGRSSGTGTWLFVLAGIAAAWRRRRSR